MAGRHRVYGLCGGTVDRTESEKSRVEVRPRTGDVLHDTHPTRRSERPSHALAYNDIPVPT